MTASFGDTKSRRARAPRFVIPMPLRFRRRGEAAWHAGNVENISRTGVLFSAEELLEQSAAVEMIFQLPAKIEGGNAAQVLCLGHVVRTVLPASSDQPPALAANFQSYKLIPGLKKPEA